MHHDIRELQDFYDRTGLGAAAREALGAQLAHIWPHAQRQTVVGFGYAVPLLQPYLDASRRVIALMPAPQGVMHWPSRQANVSVLSPETRWPLPDGLADKLVLLHGLETSERPDAVLEECARLLAPGGRAVFIVPNRRGLWARRDATPFGLGRPFSLSQIEGLLNRHGLMPERHFAALFFPPSSRRFWLRLAPSFERIGRRLSRYHAGGALLVEAVHAQQGRTPNGLSEAVRQPLRVLEGVSRPGAKPAGARVRLRDDGAAKALRGAGISQQQRGTTPDAPRRLRGG